MHNRSITRADLVAAKNLRRLYQERKHDDPNMQSVTALAELFGRSRGLVSQYLHGHTALGVAATLKFAEIFDVPPTEIRPDFEFQALVSDLPDDAIQLAIRWSTLPPHLRQAVVEVVENFRTNPAYADAVDVPEPRAGKRRAGQKGTNGAES